MLKSTYNVSVIHKNREKDYYDFWDNNLDRNIKGENLHSALVGFNETIEASNLEEAIAKVQKKHPMLTVVKKYSSKLG